ncbi:L-threonylcarbamoyladenylate synthase [Vagococcus acidifermentans]|uniref:Threonylcarbamoyl-AMP synthase n=1 Tax=Vagococcus acidifermentans TaxID=564710 RepID=A0A430AS95_9ENTE|nr:L-threonylcarbamoyladenylate synthase [Vagococcus acidifermentans]RSU10923.1 threonylcarbamoyl-AMP synthase [Vagococcus acidifermentans]
METKIFQEEDIATAAALIRAGKLVAFPTETVYGLGADATNSASVKAVYQAKGRPSDNPLIIHLADKNDVRQYVDNFSEKARQLADTFWPGPLTMIFPVKQGVLPSVVTGGLSTGAFRVPNNKKTLQLIKLAGVPLVGPSANTSGKPSPTTAEHVYHDLHGKISGILDDGKTVVGIESTVLDMSVADEPPTILRPGAITQEQLEAVIGEVRTAVQEVSKDVQPKSPGMKYKHYAPDTEVMMIDWQKNNWHEAVAWARRHGKKAGILAARRIIRSLDIPSSNVYELSDDGSVSQSMANLFAGLRELDSPDRNLDVIFVQTFPAEGLGVAYMNRLQKSADKKTF